MRPCDDEKHISTTNAEYSLLMLDVDDTLSIEDKANPPSKKLNPIIKELAINAKAAGATVAIVSFRDGHLSPMCDFSKIMLNCSIDDFKPEALDSLRSHLYTSTLNFLFAELARCGIVNPELILRYTPVIQNPAHFGADELNQDEWEDLKESESVDRILSREREIYALLWEKLAIPEVCEAIIAILKPYWENNNKGKVSNATADTKTDSTQITKDSVLSQLEAYLTKILERELPGYLMRFTKADAGKRYLLKDKDCKKLPLDEQETAFANSNSDKKQQVMYLLFTHQLTKSQGVVIDDDEKYVARSLKLFGIPCVHYQKDISDEAFWNCFPPAWRPQICHQHDRLALLNEFMKPPAPSLPDTSVALETTPLSSASLLGGRNSNKRKADDAGLRHVPADDGDSRFFKRVRQNYGNPGNNSNIAEDAADPSCLPTNSDGTIMAGTTFT